jgi:hypothetical protein
LFGGIEVVGLGSGPPAPCAVANVAAVINLKKEEKNIPKVYLIYNETLFPV